VSTAPAATYRWRRRLLLSSLVIVLILLVVPLWPWRPICRCQEGVQGDLRDIYVDRFALWLRQDKIYYWRLGDLILLRVLPWLDGVEIGSRADAIYNGECKIAEALSDDETIDGVLHVAPELVKRLKVELEPTLGPDPRIKPDGSRIVGADTRVRRSCRLFNAAVLEPRPLGTEEQQR
jgi:hypothetical protein